MVENDEVKTHCRICEPQCQLVATVEGGRLTNVRGNGGGVFPRGHLCIKASAAIDVSYDEDRVVKPLKRTGGPGEFESVDWDEALDDISSRLKETRSSHGTDSFAT